MASLAHPQSFNLLLKRDIGPSLGYHRAFCLWMLTAPFLSGMWHGYEGNAIIRDLIPAFLLLLPLIHPDLNLRHFKLILVACGTAFAARYLLGLGHLLTANSSEPTELLYLANAPLILFATFIGLDWLTQIEKTYLLKRLIGLGVFLITITAMLMMSQRAPFILTLLGAFIILSTRLFQSPLRMSIIIGLFIGLIALVLPLLWHDILGLGNKFLNVGDNNRIAEIKAALTYPSLIGYGWGFEWQSPAVGDYWVRYTHNMVLYYWLKAGIIGAGLTIGFIYIWLKKASRLFPQNMALAMAIFIPFLIHFFLYTGYKSFDLPLLLTFLVLCRQDRHPS